jgi:hypothetical protein
MKAMRTRRLLIWIGACAVLFALPYQCESGQQAFLRRVSNLKADKARECRRRADRAEAAGDLDRAASLRKTADRLDELSRGEYPRRW